ERMRVCPSSSVVGGVPRMPSRSARSGRGGSTPGRRWWPMRSIRRPHLDTHAAVSIGYPVRRDDGLPESDMLDELRQFEDHLTDCLGGSGNLLAHETSAGTRTLHYYVDG